MKGLCFKLSANNKEVIASIEPMLITQTLDPKTLSYDLKKSEYSEYYVLEEAIVTLCEDASMAIEKEQSELVESVVACVKNAEIEINIASNKMSADISITSPFMGEIPSLNKVLSTLKQNNVKRGLSTKRLRVLLQKISDAKPGTTFGDQVAKGLPPRSGKDSYIKAIVPNAIERALAPQSKGADKVDMRDFGDILCVEKNQLVACRIPPTSGRKGYTICDDQLAPNPGNWKKIKLGKNVFIDPKNENKVLAEITGLPKVNDKDISVDNVLTNKGVNVATGNIKFDGAVIVNGDVTEKMRVVATGDITINGFVESAYIEAGGDVIIMQGASGKMQTIDCEIVADGSIFVQHGQGLHIRAGKQLNIAKQLAYSNVFCKGNITVGDVKKPKGKLFASTIECGKTIIAGHVGAISGSALTIDYSNNYNQISELFEAINLHFDNLSSKNADHEIKIAGINNRRPSETLLPKMKKLTKELELERVFLNWLRINKDDVKQQLEQFPVRARVIATEKLYPGVSIKLNKKVWVAKKECDPCRIVLEEKDWTYMPGYI